MKHLYIYKWDVAYYVGTHIHHTIIEATAPSYVAEYLYTLYDVPEGNIVSKTLISKKLAF